MSGRCRRLRLRQPFLLVVVVDSVLLVDHQILQWVDYRIRLLVELVGFQIRQELERCRLAG